MTHDDALLLRDLLATGVRWRDDTPHRLLPMPSRLHRYQHRVQVNGTWWRWCLTHRTWEPGLTTSQHRR